VPEWSHSLGCFAGFSASAVAARINDSECKMVITQMVDIGNKTIDLKVLLMKPY
jgi:acetyl-CoA synthetase